MNVSPITPETLASSVVAVPPLARNADYSLNHEENEKLIRHLEAGGVSTLLYGGNAIFYHLPISEYAETLALLAETVADETLAIPSVGPAYGTMMDQAAILRDFDFPTAMILPSRDVMTTAGVAVGVRRFVEAAERPAVLYIKQDGYVDVPTVKRLMDDGLISWIKYAVVRDETAEDDFLSSLIDAVGPELIVSGIGEQPATVHLRDFGVTAFTSGCVCVAPSLSMEMLRALKNSDYEAAEQIRRAFVPLEDLRNGINPIRVLHTAITLAGIGDMGPILPLLSDIDPTDRAAIEKAARALLALDTSAARV